MSGWPSSQFLLIARCVKIQKYIFFTRIYTGDLSTGDCVEALISGWVARFGVPADITSDRGVQFSSGVWAGLCRRLGISHHSTTAYHPQSNGMVERFHRQLKDALRARLQGQDWVSQLPWVLLGLRAAPKE